MTLLLLKLLRANVQHTIVTDSNDTQWGCVLLQEQKDEVLKPIFYWPRSICDAERHHNVTRKDCLVLEWAVLMPRPYLQGSNFTIKTHHQALRFILNLAKSTGSLARWRLKLMISVLKSSTSQTITMKPQT